MPFLLLLSYVKVLYLWLNADIGSAEEQFPVPDSL